MILGPDGLNAAQATKQYHPKLLALLVQLWPLLNEQGIGLDCAKCRALGLPDGVQGKSTEKEMILECGCTRRVFNLQTGKHVIH